jgi:hypothetical protein
VSSTFTIYRIFLIIFFQLDERKSGDIGLITSLVFDAAVELAHLSKEIQYFNYRCRIVVSMLMLPSVHGVEMLSYCVIF